MKRKGLFSGWMVLLLAALLLNLAWMPAAMGGEKKKTTEIKSGEPKFVAYYFFTSKRCRTCMIIENLAREAIQTHFKAQIDAGKLVWQGVNVESAENKHFIKDFQLYSKTVVIAEYREGKVVRWVNLNKVWQYYRNKEKYVDYVTTETRAFMEKG